MTIQAELNKLMPQALQTELGNDKLATAVADALRHYSSTNPHTTVADVVPVDGVAILLGWDIGSEVLSAEYPAPATPNTTPWNLTFCNKK